MNLSNNNNTTREASTDSMSPDTSTFDSCKESASSNDDVCDVNDKLQNMSTADDKDIIVSVCANCGKEGSDVNNICNKCKKATYCNATCKKKHKKKHKKDCEEYIRLAAERAAELHDEELFKQPPPKEDCPICFVRLPTLDAGWTYMPCCGKGICTGCMLAPVYDNQGNEVDNKKCPFCRIPTPTSIEEAIERMTKRVKADDPVAIYNLGVCSREGRNGYPQDYRKALELWHRAGELGHAMAYSNIGYAYHCGRGVERDEKKARHYYELAAIGGDVYARSNLGLVEAHAGNFDRAVKHYTISGRGGHSNAVDNIKRLYSNGLAAKDDYTKALQSYQAYLGEIKSVQRDKAAAADEGYRYY